MSSRELTRWEFTCDRCGYVECSDAGPSERWERRRGLDFCPGCAVDLYRFLLNRSAQHMALGNGYRFPDPDQVIELKAALAAKGIGW